MTYRIILTDKAFRDLEDIKRYISQDSSENAHKYIEKIFNSFENLQSFPFLGKEISNSFFDYAKVRYLICLNHIAIYQINEIAKCIYIVRVLSHFQEWKDLINKDLLSSNKVLTKDDSLSLIYMNSSMYYDVWKNSLDENNQKYVPDEVFETLQDASEAVDQIIENIKNEQSPVVYAIFRNKDNANMGYVELIKIGNDWEIGYHIANQYCGKGYATRALSLFLEYLKENTSIIEVYGITLTLNKASKRVLEKNNFKILFEGTGSYQGKSRKITKFYKKL